MKSVTGSFVARLLRMTMKRKCVSREKRGRFFVLEILWILAFARMTAKL